MNKTKKKLTLSKETIRQLIPRELHEIVGGAFSCGGVSACDCSGDGETGNQGSLTCTRPQK